MKGSILRIKDLRRKIVVARNTPVKLFLKLGNGEISTRAIALEKGAKGDFIKVKNLMSNKIVRAKVIKSGQVRIGDVI
jgi:flagella basal body P-ring formation protein FlgA